MARRRKAWISSVFLVAGAAGAVSALSLPWIAIAPNLPVPLVGELLGAVGAVPKDEAVRGYEIPLFVLDTGDNLLVQTSLAATELLSGRLDRAAARALFGDRYEQELAPLVFGPALVALINLFLLRWPRASRIAVLFVAVDLVVLGTGAWFALELAGTSSSVELRVLEGIPATFLSLGLCAAGAFLISARSGRRRKRSRRR